MSSDDDFDFEKLISELEEAAEVFGTSDVKRAVESMAAAGQETESVHDAVKAVAVQDATKAAAFVDAVATLATHDAAKAVAVQDALKAVAVQDATKAAVGQRQQAKDQEFSREDVERSLALVRLAASLTGKK